MKTLPEMLEATDAAGGRHTAAVTGWDSRHRRIPGTRFWEPCLRPGLATSTSRGDSSSPKPLLQNSDTGAESAKGGGNA